VGENMLIQPVCLVTFKF